MNAKNLKILLIRSNLKQADIARDLGVTRSAVNLFIHGKLKSKRIEQYFLDLMRNRQAA